jgi:DNA-binding transcriptional ArsR family regulator
MTPARTELSLSRPRPGASPADPFDRVLWRLFIGTTGGKTRAALLRTVMDRPMNAQQLAGALGLDYTTVRHHLRVLERGGVVLCESHSYGRLYFPTAKTESRWPALQTILEKARGRGG